MERLTLSAVLDFEGCLLALASCRLVTASSLDTIDCVDATLRQAFGVLEKQPLDSTLSVGSRTGGSRRVGFFHLSQDSDRVRRLGQLIEGHDRRGAAEEVVADQTLEAEGLQVLGEACGQGAQGQCERRDGGDGPSGERVSVELRANIVEVGWVLSGLHPELRSWINAYQWRQ